MSRIDWERVQAGLERDDHRIVWKPYGLPAVTSPNASAFFDGDIAPPWDVPRDILVEVAITGGFFRTEENPHQPITPDAIREQARACAAAGASAIHLHVRDDHGYNTLSIERFAHVIEPLREEFPGIFVDGCMVCSLHGEWERMREVLDMRLLDGVPINTAATYVGDALFAKPVPMILEKTRLIIESGALPQIAVYTDGDVSNAERYLFRSGLMDSPSTWLILPALPGCSPMQNPRQMIDGLLRISSAIYDVDPEATVMVCAAGRASSYLTAVAAALGLHVRVGMEDTIWRWPHRQELLESNLQALTMAKALAEALGRDVATPARYREIVGAPYVPAPTV